MGEIVDHNVASREVDHGRAWLNLVKVDPAGGRSAVAFIERQFTVFYRAYGWHKRGPRTEREEVAQYAAVILGAFDFRAVGAQAFRPGARRAPA